MLQRCAAVALLFRRVCADRGAVLFGEHALPCILCTGHLRSRARAQCLAVSAPCQACSLQWLLATVQVAFMFNEWYKPRSVLEFPRGGSQAMVDALARGVTKRGGRVCVRSHVDEILLEGGRAAGVRLRGGAEVRARKAVVTNATLWDSQKLLPGGRFPGRDAGGVEKLPVNRSFMHLHVGFDATGLEGLGMHHIVVNSWEGGVRSLLQRMDMITKHQFSLSTPGRAGCALPCSTRIRNTQQ